MPKSRVIVEFPDRPAYAVRIGGGVVSQLGADLRAAGVAAGRCLVVCDADSAARCLPAVQASLAAAGFRVSDICVPAVEPARAWECVGELHAAFAQLALPAGAPVIVCACVQVSELASFAAATYGDGNPLVAVPASLASVLRTLAVDRIELDAGHLAPIVAPAAPSFAAVEPALLACDSAEEASLGMDELAAAASFADAGFRSWLSGNRDALASYDEDALVLALTQVLATRADAIGTQLASR